MFSNQFSVLASLDSNSSGDFENATDERCWSSSKRSDLCIPNGRTPERVFHEAEGVIADLGALSQDPSLDAKTLERRIQRLRGHSPDSAVPYSTKEVTSEKKLSEAVGMLEGNEKRSEIKVVAVEVEVGEGETETDSKYDESKESEDESCEDEACDEPEGEHGKTARGNESDLCYEHKVFEVMPRTKISPLTETSPSVESSGSDSLKTVSNLESSEKLIGDKVRGIHNAHQVVDVRPKTNLSLSKADGGVEFHSQPEGRGGVEGIASASGNSGVDQGHVPPVQRSVLEILALLHPAEHLSSMWSTFLGKFLQYLPSDSTHQSAEDNPESVKSNFISTASSKIIKHETPKVTGLILPKNDGPSLTSGLNTSTTTGVSSYLLAEKLVPVLVDLFLQAPSVEKCKMFPEVLQGLASSRLFLELAWSGYGLDLVPGTSRLRDT
ncbi:hypothetical protein U1Q18_028427 [Sarracenia purpurea var. burkii]